MPKRFASALLVPVACLLLAACSDNGTRSEVAMSRWIKRDTTLAFTLHVYRWKGENRMFTEPRTSEIRWSRLELHVVDVEWNDGTPSFNGHRNLLTIEHAVPCPELLFDSATSLLTFSYLARDRAKPRSCHEAGAAAPGAPHSGRRLAAGIPEGGGYGEVAEALDTLGLLDTLARQEAREPDAIDLTPEGRTCLTEAGPCVYPF